MARCPEIASNGSGWGVAWLNIIPGGGDSEVFFALLDASGTRIANPFSVDPANPSSTVGCPALVWTGTKFVIAYARSSMIHLASVDASGTVMGVVSTPAGNDAADPAIDFDADTGGYHLAYRTGNASSYAAYLRLNAGGGTAQAAVFLSSAGMRVGFPSVLDVSTGASLAWYDDTTGSGNLHTTIIAPDGTASFPTGPLGSAADGAVVGPSTQLLLNGRVRVLWIDGDAASPASLRLMAAGFDDEMGGPVEPPVELDAAAEHDVHAVPWPGGFAVVSTPDVRVVIYDNTTLLPVTQIAAASGSSPSIATANGTLGIAYLVQDLVRFVLVEP